MFLSHTRCVFCYFWSFWRPVNFSSVLWHLFALCLRCWLAAVLSISFTFYHYPIQVHAMQSHKSAFSVHLFIFFSLLFFSRQNNSVSNRSAYTKKDNRSGIHCKKWKKKRIVTNEKEKRNKERIKRNRTRFLDITTQNITMI